MSSKADLGDCRFYESKFPSPDELVMVKVERVESIGAYVTLHEYNNKEGMILVSELSKVRFRSVNRIVRVGRDEVVLVLRVDSEKGYIDLSKRRVSPEDIVKCEERYSKAKKVHQTIRQVAQKHGMKVDELNALVTWPLYTQYGHAFDALKEAVRNPDAVFANLNISEELKASILRDIVMRLAPQITRMRAKVDVWCFGYDGIDAVKDALSRAKDVDKDDEEKDSIVVKLIAPPQYVILASTYDKEKGKERLLKALERVRKTIKSYPGGDFKENGEIVIMGGEDDKRLEELLKDDDEYQEDSSDEEEEDEGMGRVKEEDELELQKSEESNGKREDNN